MTITPFLSYKILPSQTMIRENIRPGHVSTQFCIFTSIVSLILYSYLGKRGY